MKKIYIIGIVILIIGAGIGFWIMQDSNGTQTSQKSNQSTQEDSTVVDPQTANIPTDPSEGGKYLVIKEWNIKFLLPDPLEDDITYRFTESPSGLVAEIISSKYSNLNQSCSKNAGGFIGIYREDSTNSNQTIPPKFATIGKYNFFFAGYACEDSDKFQGEDNFLHKELIKNIEDLEMV